MNIIFQKPGRVIVNLSDKKEMQQWLDDNNVEYLTSYTDEDSWTFVIYSYTEEQKQHLAWFKLKWLDFNETS